MSVKLSQTDLRVIETKMWVFKHEIAYNLVYTVIADISHIYAHICAFSVWAKSRCDREKADLDTLITPSEPHSAPYIRRLKSKCHVQTVPITCTEQSLGYLSRTGVDLGFSFSFFPC